MHLWRDPEIISVIPSAPQRTKIRVILVLTALFGLGAFLFATGRGNDQRELYDRFFLYLPASSFLLVVVLVTTDLCVGIVERRAIPDARVVRTAIVLAIGLTVAAVLVITVLVLWFR